MYDEMTDLFPFFAEVWEKVSAEHGELVAHHVIEHLRRDVYLYWDVTRGGVTADDIDRFEGVTALIEYLTTEHETIAA